MSNFCLDRCRLGQGSHRLSRVLLFHTRSSCNSSPYFDQDGAHRFPPPEFLLRSHESGDKGPLPNREASGGSHRQRVIGRLRIVCHPRKVPRDAAKALAKG
jgi:hypothetical protein